MTMVTITSQAVSQLQALMVDNSASALKFDAEPGTQGGYDLSVSLAKDLSPEAAVHEVDGIKLAFYGMAETIFDGAVIGLNQLGELVIEMPHQGCSSGACDCGCSGDSCGTDGGCH